MGSAGVIVFSHANGFVAGTYSKLFKSLRARGFAVHALEKFGHDVDYPVSNNWPHLVEQLAHFAAAAAHTENQGVVLVGHSLGGILSLMAAARHPVLGDHPVRGVIMLDSPIVSGWRAPTVSLMKHTPLMERFSPARVSQRRRERWADRAAVLAHFQSKRSFAAWDPQVLADYVAHGFRDVHDDHGQHVELAFSREIESRIYNTLPDNIDRLLRRHPLRAPLAFIGGSHSPEMRQLGHGPLRKLVSRDHAERWQIIRGSHLYPMEQPLDTAQAIAQAIATMAPTDAVTG